MDLVGSRDIATLLGVSRQRVDQFSRDDGRFPKPVALIGRRRVWQRDDIETWAAATGRPIQGASQ